MPICKFCLSEKKLCKAHILSKNILKRISDEKNSFVLVELLTLKNLGERQDDLFDKNILCSECDNLFSPIENYFYQFITQRVLTPDKIVSNKTEEVFIYENVDEQKLRLFPLITLWRMSISNIPGCTSVSLGPLEQLVYNNIRNFQPGPYDFFPFTIFCLRDLDDIRAQIIGNPLPITIDGYKYYILPISDYIIMVRAGKNVSENIVRSSVYNNTIEVINLKGQVGKKLLDSLFSPLPSKPRRSR